MSTAQPIYSVVLVKPQGTVTRTMNTDLEGACDRAIDWFLSRNDVLEALVISSIDGIVAHYGKDGDNAPFADLAMTI